MEEFTGLFDLPGEGFVAQLRNGGQSSLYDRQGLQYLILQRKQEGLDAEALRQQRAQLRDVEARDEARDPYLPHEEVLLVVAPPLEGLVDREDGLHDDEDGAEQQVALAQRVGAVRRQTARGERS